MRTIIHFEGYFDTCEEKPHHAGNHTNTHELGSVNCTTCRAKLYPTHAAQLRYEALEQGRSMVRAIEEMAHGMLLFVEDAKSVAAPGDGEPPIAEAHRKRIQVLVETAEHIAVALGAMLEATTNGVVIEPIHASLVPGESKSQLEAFATDA